ncbi:MAG: hypothetical protein K2N72_12240 [Oscillospiraceae bacterium]|nr:hypothetical protein [Oscillospiraceae bacterium]
MKNNLAAMTGGLGNILNKPGDEMHAKITPSGRKVVTVSTDNGANKHSITEYKNKYVTTQSFPKTK